MKQGLGTALVVQWLRLCTPNVGRPGPIPGQGTKSHVPQLSSPATTQDPTCWNRDLSQPPEKHKQGPGKAI